MNIGLFYHFYHCFGKHAVNDCRIELTDNHPLLYSENQRL